MNILLNHKIRFVQINLKLNSIVILNRVLKINLKKKLKYIFHKKINKIIKYDNRTNFM